MQSTIETKPPETYLPKQTNVQAAEAAADSINNIHPSVVTENLTKRCNEAKWSFLPKISTFGGWKGEKS